jgi:hypothetical protein
MPFRHTLQFTGHMPSFTKRMWKGIKAMLQDLKSMEKKKGTVLKRGLATIGWAMFSLAASGLLLNCLAIAKPIF